MYLDSSFIPTVVAFLIVTVSPGPSNIATATIAMRHGRLRAIHFALGLGCGFAMWGIAAATGLGSLLQASIFPLTLLKVLGGAYLLWLAVQSGRAFLKHSPDRTQVVHDGNWYLRGLILNLSNPKAVLAWMAALSAGLHSASANGHVITATTICIALGFLNYGAHAIAFSISGVMATYRRIGRWVEGATACLFAATGLGLLRSAFTR
jgi:threonine efflux protein